MGTIFFVLTAAVLPFLPSGATVPRWAFLSLVCAGLLCRIEFKLWPMILCAYLLLMAWRGPIGFEAAFITWHFLLFIIVYCYAQGLVDLRKVTIGVALGMAINSIAVIAQVRGWQMIPQTAPLGGIFYNRNIASETAAMALALVVGYRMWWLIPGLLPTLYFGSRAPLAALAAVALLAFWQRSRIGAASVAAVVGAIFFLDGQFKDHLIDLDQRFGVWKDLLPGLTFFGRGLGSFIVDYPALQTGTLSLNLRFENAHNDFLQVIYELGIGGAVLICGLGYRMARVPFAPAWWALLVFLLEATLGFPLYEPVTGALAACCAGYLFGRRAPVRDVLLVKRSRIRAWPSRWESEALRFGGNHIPVAAHASVGGGLLGGRA